MSQIASQTFVRWFCPSCGHLEIGINSPDECPECGNESWEFYRNLD